MLKKFCLLYILNNQLCRKTDLDEIFLLTYCNDYDTEAAFQSYSKEFQKYPANLQENTHAKVSFQQSCLAVLLKSHFGMGVLL